MKLFKGRTDTPTVPVESPKKMVERVAAEVEAARIRDAYTLEQQEVHAKLAARTVEVQELESSVKTKQTSKRRAEIWNKVIDYSPLVTISVLAIIGQYGYLSTALEPKFEALAYLVAALAAAATESVTLFLGYHAMLALRRRDSAAGLIFASIAVGTLVAFMNYSHFTGTTANPDDLAPNATAVIFGMFSFTNPFLWRTKIRSDHRNELHENGEIEGRGVKLGRARWVLHFRRTFSVTRAAAWVNETDPAKAIALWEASQAQKAQETDDDSDEYVRLVAELEAQNYDLRMEIEGLRVALADIKVEQVSEGEDSVKEHVRPELPPASTYRFKNHPKWNDGVSMYAASVDGKQPMKQAELASRLGMTSRALASEIMRYVREDRNNVSSDSTAISSQAA